MSDFDREAEREKLREKYERDKQKREASERMSELLLQGATMTNQHCPECHSPVFRYDGKQFCPTCEKEIREDGESETETGDEAAETDAAGTDTEDVAPGAESAAGGSDEAAAPEQGTSRETTEDQRGPATADAPAPAEDRRPARVDPPARSDGRNEQEDRREATYQPEAGGEFRDAEASLKREIGSLTRKAEETRDVGRKRDLLAAAREAAETLRAIRRL